MAGVFYFAVARVFRVIARMLLGGHWSCQDLINSIQSSNCAKDHKEHVQDNYKRN